MLYYLTDARQIITRILDDEVDAKYLEKLRTRPGSLSVHAANIRDRATAECLTETANRLNDGHTYLFEDRGSHVTPRYGVVRMFKIGEAVSYTFNGDTYPCGTITRISSSNRVIETNTGREIQGRKFYRRRESGSWINDGTWSLVRGHISTQNPSF